MDTQDHINNWRETALILTAVLFLAAGIWFIGEKQAISGVFLIRFDDPLLFPSSISILR